MNSTLEQQPKEARDDEDDQGHGTINRVERTFT